MIDFRMFLDMKIIMNNSKSVTD